MPFVYRTTFSPVLRPPFKYHTSIQMVVWIPDHHFNTGHLKTGHVKVCCSNDSVSQMCPSFRSPLFITKAYVPDTNSWCNGPLNPELIQYLIGKCLSVFLFFYYPPSTGISFCVGTAGTVMWHLHLTWPCCVALGWVLIWVLSLDWFEELCPK